MYVTVHCAFVAAVIAFVFALVAKASDHVCGVVTFIGFAAFPIVNVPDLLPV